MANRGWHGTCGMDDDADVSFHMLSHKVGGTKVKTKFVEGPNPKIYRKLHLLPSFPLLHDLWHVILIIVYNPHLVLTKRIINSIPIKIMEIWVWNVHGDENIHLWIKKDRFVFVLKITISFRPEFTPLIAFSLSFTLTSALVFFDIEDIYRSSIFLRISFHSSKFIRLSFHSSSFLRISFRAFYAEISWWVEREP